jgi:hypothetical protein
MVRPGTRPPHRLGGDPPDVAYHRVATSLALRMTHDDLRPLIAARRAGELARRLAPGLPGRTPPAFPAAWPPRS